MQSRHVFCEDKLSYVMCVSVPVDIKSFSILNMESQLPAATRFFSMHLSQLTLEPDIKKGT